MPASRKHRSARRKCHSQVTRAALRQARALNNSATQVAFWRVVMLESSVSTQSAGTCSSMATRKASASATPCQRLPPLATTHGANPRRYAAIAPCTRRCDGPESFPPGAIRQPSTTMASTDTTPANLPQSSGAVSAFCSSNAHPHQPPAYKPPYSPGLSSSEGSQGRSTRRSVVRTGVARRCWAIGAIMSRLDHALAPLVELARSLPLAATQPGEHCRTNSNEQARL